MPLTILTPAASEPVSLAEAKLFLRVDHDAEDALIGVLLAAAREAVESYCGRAMIARTVRESLDVWRLDGTGAALLSVGPVISVEAVRLYESDGESHTIPSSQYSFDGGRILFSAGAPAPRRAAAGIEIEYVAGFGEAGADVPASLRLAVLHIAAAEYEQRQGEQTLPNGARLLMSGFAPARL